MDGLAADNVWNDAILDIQGGIESAPRGMKTREKINHTTTMHSARELDKKLIGY